MDAQLFVLHGSHPCRVVERALELKGIPYRRVELPPLVHTWVVRALFGAGTVPALRLDGERLSGSPRIVRRLEELRPAPPLYPDDPDRRRRVEEIEAWADSTFQPVPRRLYWTGLRRRPDALASYGEGSRLPVPAPVARLTAPLLARWGMRRQGASEAGVRMDLAALERDLDLIDSWIEEGVIGGDPPNAADLQVASTLRLLMTMEDVRPRIEPRPAGRLALRLFPDADGRLPAGALPAPAAAA